MTDCTEIRMYPMCEPQDDLSFSQASLAAESNTGVLAERALNSLSRAA
jgi:hypothetical protein